jgi:hypothetical protein
MAMLLIGFAGMGFCGLSAAGLWGDFSRAELLVRR